MAEEHDTQHEADSAPHVYKSKQVHKRRSTREERHAWSAQARARSEEAQAASVEPEQELESADVAADEAPDAAEAEVDVVESGDAATSDAADAQEDVAEDGEAAASEEDGQESAEGGASEEPSTAAGARPSVKGKHSAGLKPKRKRGKLIAAFVFLVALAAIAIAAYFALNGADTADDHADIQGQWYVAGTAVAVTIDEEYIHLTEDVSYAYTLNESDKTIRYTFGPMQGGGRYWFGDDRQSLVIEDDASTDGGSSASAAPASTEGADSASAQEYAQTYTDYTVGENATEVTLPQGSGLIAFTRQPNMDALAAREETARQARAEAERAQAELEREAEEAQAEQG